MTIFVLGTRGIPDILGGVETHCQELYPRVVAKGHKVTLITRSPYVKNKELKEYKGVQLKHIYAPKIKSLEAIIHTFLGVIYAGIKRPDVLHIHAIGPMIMTPIARLLGLKVIVTNHGPDYDRQKWGKLAKTTLKLGEFLGTKFANEVIVISDVINDILKKKYNRNDTHLIYNGVNLPKPAIDDTYIKTLGLEPDNYIIAVGRFVEEKGFLDLIKAYSNIKTNVQLVLVGDADHETSFSKLLKREASNAGIVLTGFIKGDALNQIFTYAKLFVMPSYHEGLPIALLEAMSYNLNVLVSNIPANLKVHLNKQDYFNVGDINQLQLKIQEKLTVNQKPNFTKQIKETYNWDVIAEYYLDLLTTKLDL